MANTLNYANSPEDYIQHFTHALCNSTLTVNAANDEQFLSAHNNEFSKKITRQSRRKWNARQALAARGIAYELIPACEEVSLIKPLDTQNSYALKLSNT